MIPAVIVQLIKCRLNAIVQLLNKWSMVATGVQIFIGFSFFRSVSSSSIEYYRLLLKWFIFGGSYCMASFKTFYLFRPRKEREDSSCNEISKKAKSTLQDLGRRSYWFAATAHADQHLYYVPDCHYTVHSSLWLNDICIQSLM